MGKYFLFVLALLSSFLRAYRRQLTPCSSTRRLLLTVDGGGDDADYKQRFTNVGRLYDDPIEAMERLRRANVCVIGLGGVGSWVVEGLARSGVGAMTLIDLDDICISNTNRQIQALSSTVGQLKGEALKRRVLDINPSANVTVVLDFLRPDNVQAVLGPGNHNSFTYVCDAADGVSDKAAIIDACVASGTPVVVSGGVGGLTDPTLIRTSDMARVLGDSLIMQVRKKLRQKYAGYPKGLEVKNGQKIDKKWGISCVHTLPTGSKRGTPRDPDSEGSSFRKCDMFFGNAAFSTGTVGLIMASVVVNEIADAKCTVPVKVTGGLRAAGGAAAAAAVAEAGPAMARPGGGSATSPNTIPDYLVSVAAVEEGGELPPDATLMDSHCHLQLSPLYEDSDAAINRARAAGVTAAVVCGTAPGEDWDRVEALYHKHPDFVRPQFGLHPWWIRRYALAAAGGGGSAEEEKAGEPTAFECPSGWEADLEARLLRLPNAGIGECGLDKAIRGDVPMEVQEALLRKHCALAERLERPVTIHCVGQWGRLAELLVEFTTCPIVLHSANSISPETARTITAQQSNVYFSLTGKTNNPPRVRQLLHSVIPHDRLLLETDSPDQLLPRLRETAAHNEPAFLRHACVEVADALDVDATALGALCRQNAQRVFG